MNEIVTAVVIAALVALGSWAIATGRAHLDQNTAYRWLRQHTKDEPGESHVGTAELAKGTGLTEERTHRACLSDSRIHRASGEVDSWSVWRKEPQGAYEKRGLLFL